jgi:hypothetical protein
MYKILAAGAAVAVTALIALPVPAGAVERRADSMRTSDQIEVSSARRRHYSRRYYGRYYYAQPYYGPYYGYAPAPYYRPAPFPFIFGLPF